jgi:hypothetical protein
MRFLTFYFFDEKYTSITWFPLEILVECKVDFAEAFEELSVKPRDSVDVA